MKRKYFLFSTKAAALFMGMLACGLTQPANAQAVEAQAPVPSFEGKIHYVIRVTGKTAADFMLMEPPTQMDLYLKDDNFIIFESGGQKNKMFLFIGDSNHTYVVDAPNERYFMKDYFVDTTDTNPVAVPTGKSLTVYGTPCKEYKVKYPDRVTFFYVSDNYRVNPDLYANKNEAKASFLVPGLEGRIPLKTKNVTPELTFEVECSKIELKKFELSYFRIPSHFKRKTRSTW